MRLDVLDLLLPGGDLRKLVAKEAPEELVGGKEYIIARHGI